MQELIAIETKETKCDICDNSSKCTLYFRPPDFGEVYVCDDCFREDEERYDEVSEEHENKFLKTIEEYNNLHQALKDKDAIWKGVSGVFTLKRYRELESEFKNR